MGQSVSNQFENLKDDFVKEAHNIKEIIDISHKNFLEKIKEANLIFTKSVEYEGKKMHFSIRKDSDSTFLWKQTVRINCIRLNITDERNEVLGDDIYETDNFVSVLATCDEGTHRLLTLKQFLLAHKMILYHYSCMQEGSNPNLSENVDSGPSQAKPYSTSTILDKIMTGSLSDSDECIICMERKQEVTLPCAHAYCLFCIEQWNVSNKTCPVCRETVENTDDSWVTPEIPESSEINAEIQKALSVLTNKLPEK